MPIYIPIITVATTIVIAISGWFSSSMSKTEAKVDALGTKVAEDKAIVSERLGRIDANVSAVKEAIERLDRKTK